MIAGTEPAVDIARPARLPEQGIAEIESFKNVCEIDVNNRNVCADPIALLEPGVYLR